MVFTTLSASAPYVAAILLVVIVAWIAAVKVLGRELHIIVAQHGESIGEDHEDEVVAAAIAST
jgi:AAA family ATP:ADP antiporter